MVKILIVFPRVKSHFAGPKVQNASLILTTSLPDYFQDSVCCKIGLKGLCNQYITREFQYLYSLFACGTNFGSYQFVFDFVRNRGRQQPE